MVADIQLLQGKIVQDPDSRPHAAVRLMEELALEILTQEELALAGTLSREASDRRES